MADLDGVPEAMQAPARSTCHDGEAEPERGADRLKVTAEWQAGFGPNVFAAHLGFAGHIMLCPFYLFS